MGFFFAYFLVPFCASCRISSKSFLMRENLKGLKYSVYWPKVTRMGLHEMLRKNKKPFRITRNGIFQPWLCLHARAVKLTRRLSSREGRLSTYEGGFSRSRFSRALAARLTSEGGSSGQMEFVRRW